MTGTSPRFSGPAVMLLSKIEGWGESVMCLLPFPVDNQSAFTLSALAALIRLLPVNSFVSPLSHWCTDDLLTPTALPSST